MSNKNTINFNNYGSTAEQLSKNVVDTDGHRKVDGHEYSKCLFGEYSYKVGKTELANGVQILAEFWLCTFYSNAPGKRHELPSVRKLNKRTVQIPTEVSLF